MDTKDITLKNQPSLEGVNAYNSVWNEKDKYAKLDKILYNLFNQNDDSFEHIFIKCCTLNHVYGTNIRYMYELVENIANKTTEINDKLHSNNKLSNSDKSFVVNSIAKVQLDKNNLYKTINYYSFATKYCSFHNKDAFPIYDLHVDNVLTYFLLRDVEFKSKAIEKIKNEKSKQLDEFNEKIDLRDYIQFVCVIDAFIDCYKLEKDYKKLDIYLWQFGKDHKYELKSGIKELKKKINN